MLPTQNLHVKEAVRLRTPRALKDALPAGPDVIGTVGGDTLTIKTAKGDLSWATAQLHDGWWRSIARLMSA